MSADDFQPAAADPQAERDPLEVLAAEFVDRLRVGEYPSVDEYAAAYPHLAADIRDLFPTIAAVEGVKLSTAEIRAGCPLPAMPRPERLGDFRITREIGRGGMGIVYEAVQESLARRVAVKVLPQTALLAPKHLQRFQREAQTAAGLHHSNIVPVFGVGRQDDCQYYVMQYIDGAGLDQVLSRLECAGTAATTANLAAVAQELVGAADRTASDTTPVGATSAQCAEAVSEDAAPRAAGIAAARGGAYWYSVARLGVQVAEAIAYAHDKGVLHRDIKPANLIVDTQGVVWVADFGLAKALQQEHVSRTGDVLGTPAYMAPEQLRGQADARSDVYSLGLTLYELLTLRPAFQATNRSLLLERIAKEEPVAPRRIRPEIPRDLETIVLKATAHGPERRYGSAAELAADLRCFLEDRPIQARRATSAERFWRWCRRNPIVAALAAIAAALLLLVAVTASVAYVRTKAALAGERQQRQRAESATYLALQALDRIYDQFAPQLYATEDATDGEADEPRAKPVLSEGTAAVLQNLLVFYDRLAEQGDNDEAYLEKVALANRRVGDIRHHLGQFAEARAAYQHALDLYDRLDRSAASRPHAFQQATTLTELGIILTRLGERKKAAETWAAALAIYQRAIGAGADTPELRRAMQRTQDFAEFLDDRLGPRRRAGRRPAWFAPERKPPSGRRSPDADSDRDAVKPADKPPPPQVQQSSPPSYCVVDTGQTHCFSDRAQLLQIPEAGDPFYGQDGFYQGPQPSYRVNGDGTATDLNTGLMWQVAPELDRKLTFSEAVAQAKSCRLAGHADWRLPTIKELYSLIDFNGNCRARPPVPYLDTRVFQFRFGDESEGDRLIDSQYWSSTEYVGLTMRGVPTVFGVNFADGRIKGYPQDRGPRGTAKHYLRFVRSNPRYGRNQFVDNRDGTVSDLATGLMWAKADSGRTMDWQQSLAYGSSLQLAGHDDWRLPNAKELQSIVDYTRAPDARDPARRGPAIDPVFSMTDGEAWFWSSTTHLEGGRVLGDSAVYIAFGRAMGFMPSPGGERRLMNVHGAGAQRSDPKSGDPQAAEWASGRGPQGDQVRILNYARAVRNIDPQTVRLVRPSVTPLPPLPARLRLR